MQPRSFAPILAGLVLCGVVCATETPDRLDGDPPNIVLLLVDDLGWRDLGSYGSEFYESPNIDSLAQSGVRFAHAYSASPVCSPARAALLTGRAPARIGLTDWIPGHDYRDRRLLGPTDKHRLPRRETTIAEVLKQNGYATALVGKWHLDEDSTVSEEMRLTLPKVHGFDVSIGAISHGTPPGGYYSPYENPALPDGPEGEYLTDRLVDESIAFMRDNANSPFFLFLSFYNVHKPIEAHIDYVGNFERKKESLGGDTPPCIAEHSACTKVRQDNASYASMIYAMDVGVGRIIAALEELGLDEDTIVVLTSDNGGHSTHARRSGMSTSNLPLRAGKGWLYEGGIRVPLIIRTPVVTETGSVSDTVAVGTDLFPTLLDLAGLEQEPGWNLDGISLVPAILDPSHPMGRDAVHWHYPHYHASGWEPGAAIRKGDWKLIEFYDQQRTELYRLDLDSGEQHDVANDYPEIATALADALKKWQENVGAAMPVANPDHTP